MTSAIMSCSPLATCWYRHERPLQESACPLPYRYLRAGTYYLGTSPLTLTSADSNVTWAAYPGDAAVGPVALAGSIPVANATWTSVGNGVFTTPLAINDTRREAWLAAVRRRCCFVQCWGLCAIYACWSACIGHASSCKVAAGVSKSKSKCTFGMLCGSEATVLC
jgi:hypothetical protein